MSSELHKFILAVDLMVPVIATTTPDTPLIKVKELLTKNNLEYLPVVSKDGKCEGLLESRFIQKLISTKIMEFQKKIDVLDKS